MTATTTDFIPVYVPLRTLDITDVIVRDPDDPDTEVRWRITCRGLKDLVFVVEYVTGDGKEGIHGFEDLDAWVWVAARTPQTGEAA